MMSEESSSRSGSGMTVATSCRIDTCISSGDWGPDKRSCDLAVRRAALAALSMGCDGAVLRYGGPVELSVTLADDETVAGLNRQYRDKDGPTNVLSFPAYERDDLAQLLSDTQRSGKDGPPLMLGDMILADGVLKAEAHNQNKPVAHHLSHLVVHSVLHCLGYDHQIDMEAEEMEALECAILATLDIPDPYAGDRQAGGECDGAGQMTAEGGHG